MAQIIKNRRGSLERLSAATSSFQKGELIITSGSSNLTTTNGSSIVFAATESGSVQAVNRFLMGDSVPNIFSSSIYNGLVKGVPYYASGSSTLYLLGSDKNDIPDLTGNISNFSSSVSTSISALSASIGGGSIGNSVTLLSSKTGSYATTGSNTFEGLQHINGAIEIHSGSNPELRLQNTTTGIEYHIQNGDGGNFQIHNGTTDKLLFRFLSASAAEGNQDAYFYGDLIVSQSITGHTILGTYISASAGFSGSISGIGNVTEFSTSVDSRFSASVASVTSLSASVASVTGDFSSSVAQTFTTQSARITSLEAFSGSQLTQNTALATITGSLITSASTAKSTNDAQDGRLTNIEAFSGSQLTQNTALATITGSLITSASTAKSTNDTQDGRLSNLETTSASVNISVANINSFSSSQLTQNTALGTITGSLISSASAASIAIANLNANSGSYALLSGSNVFYGTQTITGSLYVAYDLIVQGSSSLQYITASAVDLGTNTIILNNDSPAVRFGGISVVDSGSANGASGSLFWDSLNNNWIYQHPSGGAESGMTAILISGPKNSGSMGSEEHITPGKIMVAVGDDHIGDSIITQVSDNSKVNISGGLGVSGSIVVDNTIIGTGSIFLQPDITDSRKLEIYNTAATDVHIKSTGGLTFLGDDTNYVKIDDSLQTVTVVGVNGVFIETQLNVTGPISASAGFSGSISGIGNVTEYSQSVSASLAAITANVGAGVGVSITNLNSFSSSTLGRLDNIELFSSSVNTKMTEIGVVSGSLIASASTAKTTNDSQDVSITNLNTFSASVNTSVAALNTSSASQQVSLNNLNTFSGSTLGRLTNLENTSASVNTSVSALNTSSASQQVSIDALNTFSGSSLNRLSNLESTSASVNTSVSALNSSSASQQISIDALNTVSGSNLGRLTNLESTSASVNTSVSNLNLFSSSVLTQLTQIGVVSGSLITSASTAKTTNDTQDGRLGELESKSSSVDISIAALNSYTSSNTSTTALNSFTASAIDKFTEIGVVSGSLISSASAAKITNDAQDVSISNLNTTTASLNTSVSNINSFTSSANGRLSNLETTSASVNTSVSALNTSSASQQISIDALNAYTSSNTSTTALNAFTASAESRFTEIGVVSGSLIASASTAKTTNDTQDGRLSNIESFSASVNTSVSALNTSSASQQISIDALNVVSGSNLGRLTNLELTSASVNTSISNINTTTASLNVSVSNLNTTTASLNVSVAELNTYSSSLKTAFELTGSNVVVLGNLTVKGNTTSVESNVVQLGDNIIELNGTGAANGGLLVKDPTAPNTASGSLLWDSTNDYWKAGAAGAESKLLRAGGDNVVTESAQILFTGINGYETYSGSVATSFSASNASITSLSASVSSVTGEFSSSVATSFSASAASQTLLSSSFASSQATQNGRLDNLETTSGSLNSFSSSINTTIKTKLNAETVVSGSSQIDITSTTGYSTFSGSIATSISASVAGATWENLVGKPGGLVSGSVQVDITSTTGFSTFSSSIETRIQTIDGGTY